MIKYKNKTTKDYLNLLINKNTRLIVFIRRLFLVVVDLIILPSSLFLTKFLSEDNLINSLHFSSKGLLVLIPISFIIYLISGQYKSLAIYEGSRAVYLIVIRNGLIIFTILILNFLSKNLFISVKELLLLWIILTGFNIVVRFILRDLLIFGILFNSKNKKKVIIYGAGSAAALLASNLLTTNKYIIKYFVDDNKNIWGRNINGVSIKPPSTLKKINEKVDEIYLAIPSLKLIEKRRILMNLKELDIPVLEIPSIEDITSGKLNINNLKPIKIEKLLGRDVTISKSKISEQFIGLSILITGAGGSIGSEICRQIINTKAKRIIMLDNSENNLYEINLESKKLSKSDIELIPILGNASDSILTEEIFRKYKVDVVYHAAAYKHVPLVEAFPLQGLENNVFSTISLCKAARRANVSKFILVSTDKSVRPTNIMGASKRLAELVVLANAEEASIKSTNLKTNFSMVRFGNVLNSSGSVVPLFLNQIAEGGPITLTHPDINRYFMTIPEAAHLVLQASLLSTDGGEVFLLDMGAPIRIIDLARKLIKLSCLTEKNPSNPDGDIEIKIKGLRPGEKLFEEMLINDNAQPSGHPQIFKAREEFIKAKVLWPQIQLLKENLTSNNTEVALDILQKLVPEWVRYNKEIKKEDL